MNYLISDIKTIGREFYTLGFLPNMMTHEVILLWFFISWIPFKDRNFRVVLHQGLRAHIAGLIVGK